MISFSEKLNFRILWGIWCGTTLKNWKVVPKKCRNKLKPKQKRWCNKPIKLQFKSILKQKILMGSKWTDLFAWQNSHGQPTPMPTVSIYGSSGHPNLHDKISTGSLWAAHYTTHWAAHFFIFGSSSRLSTELPTVSIYGSICLYTSPVFPYGLFRARPSHDLLYL